MAKVNDLSRSLAALDQDTTLIAVVELSSKSWLVGAVVPGIERHPLKKLDPDASALLALLERWRGEAERRGRTIERVVVAYEAGRVDAEHRFAMTASGWRAG
jgi:transposase